jgi:predicted DNA-binding transcriptional regulator AlpA
MFGLNDIYTGNGSPAIEEVRLRTTKEMMAYFGYSDSEAFLEFAKKSGLPRIRLNARRTMFDPVAVQAWVDRRTIGRTR